MFYSQLIRNGFATRKFTSTKNIMNRKLNKEKENTELNFKDEIK